MSRIVPYLILFLFSFSSFAQTFEGSSGTLTANNTNYFNISVNGLNPANISHTFGLESVNLTLNVAETHQITLVLIAPDNTEVILCNQMTWGTYLTGTYFYDFAPKFINEGGGTYSSSFRPDENIGAVNNGQSGNGNWKLKIINRNNTPGTLYSWRLKFSNTPSVPVAFSTSDIPIVHINTYGSLIPDDPKISAYMSIIDNPNGINALTDTPTFTSHIGIETRGKSSQNVLKKSYGITTRDAFGADLSTSIFGMPIEEDWVLIANYNDKSLMRNALTYELTRKTGRYASRTRFCEVFINNQYRGVYHFGEKIKRDANRVNLSKLEPQENTGEDLTGGYIFKIDKEDDGGEPGFISTFPPINHPNNQVIKFLYEYPKATEISTEQKNYLANYVIQNFENSLMSVNFENPANGYRQFADDISFMDYFIITELGKNIDGYRISTFLNKDKNGKIKMGPIWDFDLAFRNANYCDAQNYTGWAFEFPCTGDYWQPPFWWKRLFEDEQYSHDLYNRWTQYRQSFLSNDALIALVDQMSNEIKKAQDRNFEKWNTMGRYIWPNPDPIAATFEEEISNMKAWILNRVNWIDQNLPNPTVTGVDDILYNKNYVISPNPLTDQTLRITQKNEIPFTKVYVKDINGKKIFSASINSVEKYIQLSLGDIKPGIYICEIVNSDTKEVHKIIVQ